MGFLNNDKKSVLLIKGQSGSGKTTFMKNLEKDLLEDRKKEQSKEGILIPIWCSLPFLKEPLTSLVQETLKYWYGFDDRRIQQLKRLVS